jgi:hypothetical protein
MIGTSKVARTGIAATLKAVRHKLGILTEDEARLAYVNEARDRVDLELRMRELDRPHRSFSYPMSRNF